MKKAIEVSKPSRDPKVKVGACIVSADGVIVGTGCNNMPAGSKDGDLPWGKKNENELKNKKFYGKRVEILCLSFDADEITCVGFCVMISVCHAEMNAVLNKNRMDIRNCTMYVTLFPCNECAKIIIESGIKEVVYLSDKNMTQVVTETARIMFELCKVKYRKLNESAFIGL